MAVTQYIGARYVPLFADPLDWDINSTYEPLTIVYHQGNSYTSRQSVPKGIDIGNTDYWVITGNYNAQIEQYRRVSQVVADSLPSNDFSSENTVKEYIDAGDSTLNTAIQDEVLARQTAIQNLSDVVNTSIGVDPIKYGADPTGANDSTNAINTCFAENLDKPIKFTSGVYRADSAIIIPFSYTGGYVDFNGSHIISSATDSGIAIGVEIDDTHPDHGQAATFVTNFTLQTTAEYGIRVLENFKNCRISNFEIHTNKNGMKLGETGAAPLDAYISNFFINCTSSLTMGYTGIDIRCTDSKISNGRIYNPKIGVNCNNKDIFINDVHFLVYDADSLPQMDNTCCCVNNPIQIYMNHCYCDTYPCFINIDGNMENRIINVVSSRAYCWTNLNEFWFIHLSGITTQTWWPFNIGLVDCQITENNKIPINKLHILYIPELTSNTYFGTFKQSMNNIKLGVRIEHPRSNDAEQNYSLKTNSIAANNVNEPFIPRYWPANIDENKWLYIGTIYTFGTASSRINIDNGESSSSFIINTPDNGTDNPNLSKAYGPDTLQLGCTKRAANIIDLYVRSTSGVLNARTLSVCVNSALHAFSKPGGCSSLLQESAPCTTDSVQVYV